jgi:Zn-dependent protease
MLFNLLFSEPILFIALVFGIVMALTVHEFSHALVANTLGDPTAERAGRLTLNPLSHLDPVGFLMLLFAGFGFARPVPYNPMYLKDRRIGPVLIGLAGPLSNVVFATVCALVWRIVSPQLGDENMLVQFLLVLSFLNINLAIFNLIPIPPLDGSKALFAILNGPRWDRLRFTLETQGPFILLSFILIDNLLGIGLFSGLLQFFGNAFFHLMGVNFGF